MIIFARLLPLAWESPERCNLFGLLGNFQRCLQCGSENSLISYGISRWQISVCLQAFSHSLHLQPLFFRWLHHPFYGLDLLLLLHRFYRLGQRLPAQIIVQVFMSVIVVGEIPDVSVQLDCQLWYAFLPASSLSRRQWMRPYPCNTSMAFGTLAVELRMT